jgi:glucosamine-6-phosphate deaminase
MNLIVVNDYESLSRTAAGMMAQAAADKPDASMVLATGDTPMGAYAELAKLKEAGTFDPSRLRIFQLDGYLGLALDDPRSLYGWLKRSFLDPLSIKPEQVTMLPDDTSDPEATCKVYDEAVAQAGAFDLSVLGLGPNGHLGFNEPPSPANVPTRRVQLTEASIESNARYWGGRDKVPHEAITCGMKQLLAAKQTLLVVSGARKVGILKATMEGPITPEVPASLLRTAKNVTVIADRAALGMN